MARMNRPAPVEITYKNMRFLITHNPTNATLNKFIEVSLSVINLQICSVRLKFMSYYNGSLTLGRHEVKDIKQVPLFQQKIKTLLKLYPGLGDCLRWSSCSCIIRF